MKNKALKYMALTMAIMSAIVLKLEAENSKNEREFPVIAYEYDLMYDVGDDIDYFYGIVAYDEQDGDITEDVIVVVDESESNGLKGIYKVVYQVKDSDGNTTEKERMLYIK